MTVEISGNSLKERREMVKFWHLGEGGIKAVALINENINIEQLFII